MLAANLVVLVLAPPQDVGQVPVVAADVPAPPPSAARAAPGADDAPSIVVPGLDRVPAAREPDASAPAASVPTRIPPAGIRLPSLDVDAAVHAVALEDDGAMEIPDEVADVGWYVLGPAPGEPGSAVLAGHVDGGGRQGAFWDLRTLDPGDRFEVDHVDGSATSWEVVARRTHAKDELPIAELFTRDGPPRLTLITCGGAFDPVARSYEDNVVIHAVPVTANG